MTRIEHISQQLATHPSGRSGEIRVTADELEVRLQLADWDRLGCLLDALEVRSPHGAPPIFDPHALARRVTYLGETLEVIEMVNGGERALLRSTPPCTREGNASFFEIALNHQTGFSLMRFSVDRQSGNRQRISAPLARHTLDRLLADLMELATHR